MDNIDSSISHELFARLGSKPDDLDHLINNVFQLNEYVQHHHSEEFPQIHLYGNPPSQSSDTLHSVQLAAAAVGQLAASASPEIDLENAPTRFSQYSPTEKPSRLGRPRKHQQNLPDPLDSSSQNLNQAVVSKFRFDNKPVEGPGSRGGKLVRAIPKGKITTMKRQSTLPFLKEALDSVDPSETTPEQVLPSGDIINPIDDISDSVTEKNHSEEPKASTPSVLEQTHEQAPEPSNGKPKQKQKQKQKPIKAPQDPSEKPPPKKRGPKPGSKRATSQKPRVIAVQTVSNVKKRSKLTEPTRLLKKYKSSKLVSTSRTTVLNTAHKVSRQLPGPLVGLFYDLYDDNVIGATQNSNAADELIAFGFRAMKSPYASDIIFIIEFLNKFADIIEFPSVSPQEIESGLSLPNISNQEQSEDDQKYDPSFISSKMKQLFLKLMGLALNRKRGVVSHSSAILELKPLSVTLGLPAEWRENIDQPPVYENEAPGSPVDPSHPDIAPAILYKDVSRPAYNPFTSLEFEQLGLEALKPIDRLILIRILVQWALSTSEIIKSYIFKNSQNADIPGDKETYYAPRAILKGFKNAFETKIEAELKLNKREDEVKYYDPTSDPLEHCFRIRIHEGLVGDLGFNIGRFYLCRTASKSNGGLASVKKMTSTWNGPASASDLPSEFKLYVQDIHSMLVQSLAFDGFEFDTKGTQLVEPRARPDPSSTWYEVASSVSELASFVNALSNRLGITANEQDNVVPMTSSIYKPMLYLYEYLSGLLPLLIRQESVEQILANKDDRTSRQRDVNYNERQAGYNFELEDDIKEGDDEEFEEYQEEAGEIDEDDDYLE